MYKKEKNVMPKKMMLNSKMEKGTAGFVAGKNALCRFGEYLRPFKEKKILY